ncbi:MAG TPA: hypothetical protein VK670_13915 [Silvibacterium sp.]|nr:hypothetical protein [Silvibacterium sp.]
MKALGFGSKQFGWAGRGFERVTKIGQSHERDCMFDIPVATDVEGGPTGIGNPAVLFGEFVIDEEVTNGAWKRNIDVSPEVNMTDFSLA